MKHMMYKHGFEPGTCTKTINKQEDYIIVCSLPVYL